LLQRQLEQRMRLVEGQQRPEGATVPSRRMSCIAARHSDQVSGGRA
jgi:hypothetical protein